MDQLMNSSKRILITGSNGFLGQKLTDLLVSENKYSILAVSKSVNRNPKTDGYSFRQLDITIEEDLASLIADFNPTHIVHTAAMTSVEACEEHAEACQKLNVDSVAFLAERCKAAGIHLTFISTDFVFDGKAGPYSEQDPANPVNAYGHSKLAAEDAITKSGCEAAILRTILVYGVIADKKRSNLVLWAKNKLENKEEINVVNDQWRMPTWVDDLAAAALLSVEKKAQGIYHISGDSMYSILEVIMEVAEYWNLDKTLVRPISAATIGQAENRPQTTGFILEKAQQQLGYVPTSLLQSLEEINKQLHLIN